MKLEPNLICPWISLVLGVKLSPYSVFTGGDLFTVIASKGGSFTFSGMVSLVGRL